MGRLAFIFPGQGSQYVGMAREMVESFPEAREVFDLADRKLGYQLSELCFHGPEDQLKITTHTQPALLATSIACLRLLEREGIQADYLAGHSLGEYSALVAAKVIDFGDALLLVEQRGKLMQEAVPAGEGSMAAILGLSIENLLELCKTASEYGLVEPANYNCPGQIVIAGSTSGVRQAVKMARDFGAKRAMLLPVSGPFHSSLLEPAGLMLKTLLEGIKFENSTIPIVANVHAELVTTAAAIKQALFLQVNNSVKWEQSIRRLLDLGVDTFVEIGAGKVLSGLIKKIDNSVEIFNIEDPLTLELTLNGLKKNNYR